MALSKDKKSEVVAEISDLMASSKLTVVANYKGTSVKSMQELRAQAKEGSTTVKVYKNRLVKIALSGSEKFKSSDTNQLTGQLIYAFNDQDEVAPAQVLANFAKTNPQITFVGAFDQDGKFISSEDVTALSNLPSKETLRSQLVGTLSAPLSGFVSVVSGNTRGLLTVLNARAESLN